MYLCLLSNLRKSTYLFLFCTNIYRNFSFLGKIIEIIQRDGGVANVFCSFYKKSKEIFNVFFIIFSFVPYSAYFCRALGLY